MNLAFDVLVGAARKVAQFPIHVIALGQRRPDEIKKSRFANEHLIADGADGIGLSVRELITRQAGRHLQIEASFLPHYTAFAVCGVRQTVATATPSSGRNGITTHVNV